MLSYNSDVFVRTENSGSDVYIGSTTYGDDTYIRAVDNVYLLALDDIWIEAGTGSGDDVGVDCGGDFDVNAGGSKNCLMDTTRGKVRLGAIESPQIWFEEKISSQLINGSVEIMLDPIFIECITVDAEHPMNVIATPTANCNGLWIEKFSDKIIVHELNSGISNSSFDVVISALRKGLENRRFDIKNKKPTKSEAMFLQGYAVIKKKEE